MKQPKDTLVVTVFESSESIYVDTRHLLGEELQVMINSLDGVMYSIVDSYRLNVGYGKAFSPIEVTANVLAALITYFGKSVEDFDIVDSDRGLRQGRSIEEIIAATKAIIDVVEREALSSMVDDCDKSISFLSGKLKDLRRIRRTAARRLAKLG